VTSKALTLPREGGRKRNAWTECNLNTENVYRDCGAKEYKLTTMLGLYNTRFRLKA